MNLLVLKSDYYSKDKLVFGIDEAGRGPIIGPMVVACVGVAPLDIPNLIDLGVADSKTLSRSSRENLFGKILKLSKIVLAVFVDPKTIDRWVLGKKNLNRLEAYTVSKILEKIPDKLIYKVFIDSPSGPEKFIQYLKEFGVNTTKIVLDFKADVTRPVVSAASIIAKVLRDKEIEKIKKVVGKDFGSGYLTDTKTRKNLAFLKENYPEFVRESWKVR